MPITDMSQFKPSAFVTKAGKLVQTRRHFASFGPRHNSCKARTFLVLYHRLYRLRDNSGLSLSELAGESGVSYDYLRARLGKWHSWKYLKRSFRCAGGDSRPLFVYSLAQRGKHFVEDVLPDEWRERYLSDIRAFKGRGDCGK